MGVLTISRDLPLNQQAKRTLSRPLSGQRRVRNTTWSGDQAFPKAKPLFLFPLYMYLPVLGTALCARSGGFSSDADFNFDCVRRKT